MPVLNFNAGPASLPPEVLKSAADALIDFEGHGLSIAEISHRSTLFLDILDEYHILVRQLLQLPDSHDIIITQGGARLLFALIPMNLIHQPSQKIAYIDTGYWAHQAATYARHYADVDMLASSAKDGYRRIPDIDITTLHAYSYVGLCSNNTIYGTQYQILPHTPCPMVVDMSSDLFSRPVDFSHIDLAFACAQKNIGIAGMSLVIVNKDLLAKTVKHLPPVLSLAHLHRKGSNYHTPPIVPIYLSLLMLRWMQRQGGLQQLHTQNQYKASLLYQEIERNSLFYCPVHTPHRSVMNCCFFAHHEATAEAFRQYCKQQNIVGINGHKQAGGFRASLYNAQSLQNVLQLILHLQAFEKQQNT